MSNNIGTWVGVGALAVSVVGASAGVVSATYTVRNSRRQRANRDEEMIPLASLDRSSNPMNRLTANDGGILTDHDYQSPHQEAGSNGDGTNSSAVAVTSDHQEPMHLMHVGSSTQDPRQRVRASNAEELEQSQFERRFREIRAQSAASDEWIELCRQQECATFDFVKSALMSIEGSSIPSNHLIALATTSSFYYLLALVA